jgi:tetratricopeptide (TPR) repeat protein
LDGEGVELSETYKVGTTYPAFILCNSKAEEITRWTGYSTPDRLVSKLTTSLNDLTTVNTRISRLNSKPALQDALLVARHYENTQQWLNAIKYYRLAEGLGGSRRLDYSYDICQNMVNAAWNEIVPFDSVYPMADIVLTLRKNDNVRKVGILMSSLCRKFDNYKYLEKYLQAGINATANSRDRKFMFSHENLKADYEFHIKGDSAGASRIKVASLGKDWNKKPNKVFELVKWYAERKIFLTTAKQYCDWLLTTAQEDKHKAQVYNSLADVYEGMGNIEKAYEAIETAISLDPDHPLYKTNFDEILEKVSRK